MYSFTCHEAATDHKESYNGMKLEQRPSSVGPERQVIQDPTLRDPICHKRGNAESRWDWRPFKVF